MNYEIILIACKYNSWAVNIFMSLLDIYFPNATVTLAAEDNLLPTGKFIRVPDRMLRNGECPKNKFSDSLTHTLHNTQSKIVLIMLADYWIYDYVNVGALSEIADFMASHEDLLRVDVGSHFIPNYPMETVAHYHGVDVLDPGTKRDAFYPTSLCPGMWNRDVYLTLLSDGWDPWMTESITADRYINSRLKSYWSHPGPIRYFNALRGRDDTTLVMRRSVEDIIKPMIPNRFNWMYED